MGNKEHVGFYSYEEYCVSEVLKDLTKDGDVKNDYMPSGFLLPPDLYVPNGVPALGMTGETVVEVKKHLSYSSVKNMASYYETHGEFYNVLVVYFESGVTKLKVKDDSQKNPLRYISYKDLKSLRKNKKAVKNSKQYYKDKAKRDWREEREEIIQKAKMAVEMNNNTLFLGAGVSASAKMPDWKDLLKGLMGEVQHLNDDTLIAFKEMSSHVLEECGNSDLIMARYLQTAIGLQDNHAAFSEKTRDHLYNENNTSKLLTMLARIIQQKKVKEVITYNFDDLLEQNLAKLKLKDGDNYTSISKDAEIKGHNILPIYHVHGILPKEGPVDDMIVFSEKVYHDRYSNAYHWSNVEQLHALTRMHCFFVGLSMNDPNLRRLLDAAHNMNRTDGDCHYAFLRRKQMDKYCLSDLDKSCKYVHVSESLIDKKMQKDIYNLNYSVIEQMFNDLDVKVIWFEDFDELPELVGKVFGLSLTTSINDELIAQCEKKIEDIQNIEDNMPKFNAATFSINDVMKIVVYKNEHGEEYRKRIIEVKDLLNDLSDSIDFKGIVENEERLRELQNQVPAYSDNMTGIASFYRMWLETVKKLLEV